MDTGHVYIKYAVKKSFVQKKLHPKMFIPKIATMVLNMFKLGPHIFVRSTLQLFKATLAIRIITSVLVLVYDLAFLLSKRISKKQFAINSTVTASLLIGGATGWYAGQRAMIGVIAENTALWFIIAFVSSGFVGYLMDKLARALVLSRFTSDAEDIALVFDKVFKDLMGEYKISHEDALKIAGEISLKEKICVSCFCACNRERYADDFLRPYFQIECPLKNSKNSH